VKAIVALVVAAICLDLPQRVPIRASARRGQAHEQFLMKKTGTF
jgi:hypothetical protein